jgi:acyl carrier protein
MITPQQIVTELQSIFQKEFSDSSIILNDETTAKDIAMWDSLTHMGLMDTIERHFEISFSLDEMISFKNVGDLRVAITAKLN